MVKPEKQEPALLAINAVLVLARAMAYEKAPHAAIADVLDSAEYLPMLLLEATDQTALFRATLDGLASRYPGFNLALQKFDAEGEPSEEDPKDEDAH